MTLVEHDFEAVLHTTEDNETLGRVPIDVDWEPAVESTRLLGLRLESIEVPDLGRDAKVTPIWHAALGKPHVEAFEISIASRKAGEVRKRFPAAYCSSAVLNASKTLATEGKIRDGSEFEFYVTAFRKRPGRGEPRKLFNVKEVAPGIHIREEDVLPFSSRSVRRHPGNPSDLSVFIPEQVLEEAEELTRNSPTKETGGILIGHILRDPASRELYLAVTEQLPAEYTESSSTRVTFTSDTWARVNAALNLRKKNEIILGFWHSHLPVEWCKKCPPERRENCHWARGFFSADDRALHRAVFPRAYSVALVETFTDSGVKHDLFGWVDGQIGPVGFFETPARQEMSSTGGNPS